MKDKSNGREKRALSMMFVRKKKAKNLSRRRLYGEALIHVICEGAFGKIVVIYFAMSKESLKIFSHLLRFSHIHP